MKSLIPFLFFLSLFLLLQPTISIKKSITPTKPCKQLTFYYHNFLFNVTKNDITNSTSAAVTNPTVLGDHNFGKLVIFNDPVTKDTTLHHPPAARAQGFYFYDMKCAANKWIAYTLWFNSKEYNGTISIMGADLLQQEKRDLAIVGGTGDFFMARGIATVETDDATEEPKYARFKMDIKLYECY